MNIWRKVQVFLVKWLLERHKYYDTISSAGPEGGGSYDTYWIWLIKYADQSISKTDCFDAHELGELDRSPEVEYRLQILLNSVGELKIRELKSRTSDPDKPLKNFDVQLLSNHSWKITHFYRDLRLEYAGPFVPALRRALGCNFRIFWFRQVLVWIRSRRFRVETDYADTMDALVRASSSRPGGLNANEVLPHLYGDRIRNISVGRYVEALGECQVVLSYLAHIGEINQHRGEYMPNAATLHSINERRRLAKLEKRERKLQHNQLILTLVLAVSSASLAFVEYLKFFGANLP